MTPTLGNESFVSSGPDVSSGPVPLLASRDDDDLSVVRRYAVLDAPSDGAFDRIAGMAAVIFGTPMATVSIVDEDRVWFAAAKGLDGVAWVGTEPGLCASAVNQIGPYLVRDARSDPRTAEHPLVTGSPRIRFYAAAPIITPDGHALGTVSAFDSRRRRARPEQLGLLGDLADMVAELLHAKLSALRLLRDERAARAAETGRPHGPGHVPVPEPVAADLDLQRPAACQLGGTTRCDQPAELKVADSWGDSAWGCWEHAEDALRQVPSVFLAQDGSRGLRAYRARPTRPAEL